MYYFKIMCETVHKQGGTLLRPILPGEKIRIDEMLSAEFVRCAKVCENFVFSPENLPDGPKSTEDIELAHSIDAPFKCFSIEVAGGKISVSAPDDAQQVDVECIMIYEVEPSRFLFYTLYNVAGVHYVFSSACHTDVEGLWGHKEEEGHTSIVEMSEEGKRPSQYAATDEFQIKLVQEFLKRLSRETEGLEKVSDRVTVRSGGQKEIIKIKRVVHVAPKKLREGYQQSSGREIDWSQAWIVRGHWRCFWADKESRTLDRTKLGKDRNGDYCVPGRTWVEEHRKGPEDLDPVHKTRIVSR